MTLSFPPPALADVQALGAVLKRQGYAVLGASSVAQLAGVSLPDLMAWCPGWNDLPPDNYLRWWALPPSPP